jgi:hypothetical protein
MGPFTGHRARSALMGVGGTGSFCLLIPRPNTWNCYFHSAVQDVYNEWSSSLSHPAQSVSLKPSLNLSALTRIQLHSKVDFSMSPNNPRDSLKVNKSITGINL